jgi:hypothetical protein
MKVKLTSGKIVETLDEYGPEQSIRAAELADAPAEMSLAQSMLFNIATTFVVIKSVTDVDGTEKTPNDLIGNAVRAREILLTFRKSFKDAEWTDLHEAMKELFDAPKPAAGKWEIIS